MVWNRQRNVKEHLRSWLLATASAAAFATTGCHHAGPPLVTAAPAPQTSGVNGRPAGGPPPAWTRDYGIQPPAGFLAAIQRGTRTDSGAPGPKYWQQWATYKLEAELNPISKRLSGKGTATYYNRSPDTLRTVYVELRQNIFAPNAKHNTTVPWALEGIDLQRVAAQGTVLAPKQGYEVDGTIMRIDLPHALPPGDSANFEFAWRLRVPPDGAPRGGQDGEVWFLSYWYPQFAVYDDWSGWHTDQYYGNAEFYMDYADYDVTLTVPAGWLVDATGTLQNAADVLSPATRARLDTAAHSTSIVHVVGDSDRVAGRSTTTGTNGQLTWHFRAHNVRDFSWATSAKYRWDAVATPVGPDTTVVYAFYRPAAERVQTRGRSYWDRAADYGHHVISFYSRYLWPYPYPHASVIDGPSSCGGMEFPMMTCLGGTWDSLTFYEVVAHELGHQWFPMVVGSDEKRYAWMDEGFTQFDQSQALADQFPADDDEQKNRAQYLRFAERGGEAPMMRHGDHYPSYAAYGVASYYKPAAVLIALRKLLGREVFLRAFREYGHRWAYKHPSPYDFFNTVNDVAGRNLDWFWRTWFFETWTLDQAIDTVRAIDPAHDSAATDAAVHDSLAVIVQNRGRAPMPVYLEVTRADGSKEQHILPVEVWLGGANRVAFRIARQPALKSVTIDPEHALPDLERGNQTWPR